MTSPTPIAQSQPVAAASTDASAGSAADSGAFAAVLSDQLNASNSPGTMADPDVERTRNARGVETGQNAPDQSIDPRSAASAFVRRPWLAMHDVDMRALVTTVRAGSQGDPGREPVTVPGEGRALRQRKSAAPDDGLPDEAVAGSSVLLAVGLPAYRTDAGLSGTGPLDVRFKTRVPSDGLMPTPASSATITLTVHEQATHLSPVALGSGQQRPIAGRNQALDNVRPDEPIAQSDFAAAVMTRNAGGDGPPRIDARRYETVAASRAEPVSLLAADASSLQGRVGDQVFDGILRAIESVDEASAPDAPTAAKAEPPPPLAPVRVLKLQLAPEQMGQLTIMVSLRDNILRVRLDADRESTVETVGRERELLSQRLAGAGYDVDQLLIGQRESGGATSAAADGSATHRARGDTAGFDQSGGTRGGFDQRPGHTPPREDRSRSSPAHGGTARSSGDDAMDPVRPARLDGARSFGKL